MSRVAPCRLCGEFVVAVDLKNNKGQVVAYRQWDVDAVGRRRRHRHHEVRLMTVREFQEDPRWERPLDEIQWPTEVNKRKARARGAGKKSTEHKKNTEHKGKKP